MPEASPGGRPATHIIFKIFRNSGFSHPATRFAGRSSQPMPESRHRPTGGFPIRENHQSDEIQHQQVVFLITAHLRCL
jgi:hypothetical protein